MPSTRHNQTIGQKGEDIATRFLVNKGYKIIRRNYRCWHDEIDIIARQGEVLVFVEVKTRATDFASGEESVFGFKQHKLMRVVEKYLSGHELEDVKFRIDLINIDLDWGLRRARIKHYEDIF